LVRNPERLNLSSQENVKIHQGDLLDPSSLRVSLEGIEVAYYLVHSMADGVQGYIERDHLAADHFGTAAREAGVRRIIYLGGWGTDKSSPALEPGSMWVISCASQVPTTVCAVSSSAQAACHSR
jgi:uncharacterized protein YbjT (DUF2867 family)